MKNINKEKNCCSKMIYFDTYLNYITPKCVLLKKLEIISNELKTQRVNIENQEKKIEIHEKKIESQEKAIKALIQYLSKKDPNFDFSKFKFD